MTKLDMYICDKCESYLNVVSAYEIAVDLDPHDDNEESPQTQLGDVYHETRHLCRTCAEQFIKDFKLDIDEDDLIEKFKGIKLVK